MKISKLLCGLTLCVILFAFVPPREVSAHIEITSNMTIISNATWVTDIVVKNGATLTIAPNVTVTVNCAEGHTAYASGKDPNKIELIIEDGALVADQVTFQGAEANSCWYGIEVLDNGTATITRSTIANARVGLTLDKSRAVISRNTITNIRGIPLSTDLNQRTGIGINVVDGDDGILIENNTIDGLFGGASCSDCLPLVGGVAYGMLIARTNNITIQGNHIEDVYGGDAGVKTFDASDGANGTNGVFGAPEPTPGEDGEQGSVGGQGGDAYGIYVHSLDGKTVSINNNTIERIIAGDGKKGQNGGFGGDGGDAGEVGVNSGDSAPINGIMGGAGGKGGAGGLGGNGGSAYGIYAGTLTVSMTNNQIGAIWAGQAGAGGMGGAGGDGGNGGDGSSAYYDPTHPAENLVAGYGGIGGTGGNAGATGASGNGGSAYGVYVGSSILTAFAQNTINDVSGTQGVIGSPGRVAGAGGNGGRGGYGNFSYPMGGAGGVGGNAGVSARAGNGGNGGSAYGLHIYNSEVTSIESNIISQIVSGSGKDGGNGTIASAKGGTGGAVGNYPNVSDPNVEGGIGGIGSTGGLGGNGGIAGFAYGIFGTAAKGNTLVVNNLIKFVWAPAGGNGGAGSNGGIGGIGGSGNATNGVDQPGGDGGKGGRAGNGGVGGLNVSGTNLFNAYGIHVTSGSTTGSNWTVTNNTIANISSENSRPVGGLKGIPGSGGAGGTGDPAGSTGATGVAGVDGNPGEKGQTAGYYSGAYATSALYNNIIVNIATAPLSNSVGLFKGLNGVLDAFKFGDLYGWQKNYGDSLSGINSEGTIYEDPLFVDLTADDYHLMAASNCVEGGFNTAPGVPDVDLDGNPRLQGSYIDMGAYELEQSADDNFYNYLPLITK